MKQFCAMYTVVFDTQIVIQKCLTFKMLTYIGFLFCCKDLVAHKNNKIILKEIIISMATLDWNISNTFCVITDNVYDLFLLLI